MPVLDRPRLRFEIDLSDPKAVYHLPEFFTQFLKDNDRDFEAQQFLQLVMRYMERTPIQELRLDDVCTIAGQYADIYDVSGVPFDENAFLRGEDSRQQEREFDPATAEGVLEDLDTPPPSYNEPKHPDVVLQITHGTSLEELVWHSIVALREDRYSRSASELANELRHLTRDESEVSALDFIQVIRSYIKLVI